MPEPLRLHFARHVLGYGPTIEQMRRELGIKPRKPKKPAMTLEAAKGTDGKDKDKADEKKANEKKEDKKEDKKEEGKSATAEANKKPAEKPAPNEHTGDWNDWQDDQLVKLKGENKTWNEIAATLGKTKGQVNARFKQLNAGPSKSGQDAEKKEEDTAKNEGSKANAAEGGAKVKDRDDAKDSGGKDGEKGKDGDKAKEGDKSKDGEKVKDGGDKAKEGGKAKDGEKAKDSQSKKKETSGKSADGKVKDAADITADDVFSAPELHLIANLLFCDQDELWIRVASRFYDRTDRRLDPELIRKKFMSE